MLLSDERINEGMEILAEIANDSPVRDERGINVCAFCDHTWPDLNGGYDGHEDDCLWVRIHHLMKEGDR